MKRGEREINKLVRLLASFAANLTDESSKWTGALGGKKGGFHSSRETLLLEIERLAPCPPRKDVPIEARDR
jgi:hypothetical protein